MQGFKNTLYKIIGERIKYQRKKIDLSQEDLSNHLKLNRSSISNIETGRHQIPLFILYELSTLLKINIHDLIPMNSEVIEKLNSENKDFTEILEAKTNLNENQKESIEDIIKQLGYDN